MLHLVVFGGEIIPIVDELTHADTVASGLGRVAWPNSWQGSTRQ